MVTRLVNTRYSWGRYELLCNNDVLWCVSTSKLYRKSTECNTPLLVWSDTMLSYIIADQCTSRPASQGASIESRKRDSKSQASTSLEETLNSTQTRFCLESFYLGKVRAVGNVFLDFSISWRAVTNIRIAVAFPVTYGTALMCDAWRHYYIIARSVSRVWFQSRVTTLRFAVSWSWRYSLF